VIDQCRLNLNNSNQFIFPDQYGEHTFDKRTKLNEFMGILEVDNQVFPKQQLEILFFRMSSVREVIFI